MREPFPGDRQRPLRRARDDFELTSRGEHSDFSHSAFVAVIQRGFLILKEPIQTLSFDVSK